MIKPKIDPNTRAFRGHSEMSVAGLLLVLFASSAAAQSPPSVTSVSPSSGSGYSTTFTATFSDSGGASQIIASELLIRPSLNPSVSCGIAFMYGSFYLFNDVGNGLLTPITPGTSQAVSNSYCTIKGTGASSTSSGTTLSWTLSVGFSTAMSGTQQLYLSVLDGVTNLDSGWQDLGTWTGPTGSTDPRRIGVRPTGAYWGGSSNGENIDVLSGNLNFTMPLLNAQRRGGGTVPFNLAYNSQNWRQDSGGTWNLGADVGYGYGWKLLTGSLEPFWGAGTGYNTIDHYVFTDSTGAQYTLGTNNSGVWSSAESIYVWFDSNAGKLHFRDGTFWVMGDVSAASEEDAATEYPTIIEDTNGNQILITYQPGIGMSGTNSSARISTIEDVRAYETSAGGGINCYSNCAPPTYTTYAFSYNADSIPHLTSITNYIQTGEAYTLSYTGGQTLTSPFNSETFGTTTWLSSIAVTSLTGMTTGFTYDTSGELTKVTLPLGGYFGYTYSTNTYSSTSVSYREVTNRALYDGTTVQNYPLTHESSPAGPTHQYTIMVDPSPTNTGQKKWTFSTTSPTIGLVTRYEGQAVSGPTTKTRNDFTWTQDSTGNNYISNNLTTLDPGASYQAQKATAQTLDIYGNVTQVQNYNFGNLSTPARTYNYMYLNSSAYTSQYIFNRLVTATATPAGGSAITLASNQYDVWGGGGLGSACTQLAMTAAGTGAREWDSAYTTSVTTRGDFACSSTTSGYTINNYDASGNIISSIVNGVTASLSSTSATNFAAPSSLTVNSQTTSLSWNSFLGLTSQTGPNGDTATTLYDSYARVIGGTSPFGASSTVSYSLSSANTTSTVSDSSASHYSQASYDGLGRTTLNTTGYTVSGTNTTWSLAESVYSPCACSPMGKLQKQAMPHSPGGTQYWTVYTYDGIGRTTSVLSPDGASTTTYLYQGNTVKVTDPAGKWKTFTMDAFGNLTNVVEPDPVNGSPYTYTTTYTYDVWNNLSGVNMPRPTGTQTRSFTYSGPYLISATNPENGTISYTYNANNKVATKTDAKGQAVKYTYDTYARLTEVQRYPTGLSNAEDTCQQENYYYDTNPFDSTYSGSYSTGRLTAVQYFGGSSTYGVGGSTCDTTFIEMYNYSQAGAKTGKRLRLTRTLAIGSASPAATNLDFNSTYSYDTGGRMTAIQYPGSGPSWGPVTGPNLGWAYDNMGRVNTMTDLGASSSIITGTTYGPSNELKTITGNYSETRSYNTMLQLTGLSVAPSGSTTVSLGYSYPSSTNNGKIISQTDAISGETVTYAYDALNRLASAAATSGTWGQSYSYDGFGNLTAQTVTAGSAPAYSASYDVYNHGGCVDLNGNNTCQVDGAGHGFAYDVENRAITLGNGITNPPFRYSYAPGNRRVWRGLFTSSALTTDEVTFWGVNGQKLAVYQLTYTNTTTPPTAANWVWYATQTGTNYYFGSKLIKNASGYVGAERLGSIGKFYPWGQEKPSATTNGTEKFTGYFRDSETGLDYANNRYHNPGTGRFMTPDPYTASAGPTDPGSWNRYAYTRGDPVNRVDPSGMDDCDPGDPLPCTINVDIPDIGFDINVEAQIAAAIAEANADAAALASELENNPPCIDSVQLYTRGALGSSILGKLGASHSFIQITGPGQTVDAGTGLTVVTVEGYQTANGQLLGQAVAGNGLSLNNPLTATKDGSPQLISCDQANTLEAAANNFKPVTYIANAGQPILTNHGILTVPGYNSNSFLHWLLNLEGWVGYYANTPAEQSIGWNAFPIAGN